MKVEHVASSSAPRFYKRLVRVLGNEEIKVLDVKYSTTPMQSQYYEEMVEYSALVLYEDKTGIETNLDFDEEYRASKGQ